MMTFGEKLKQSRESKGISQAELARRVGISRAAISRYESGERTQISAPICVAICNVLEITPKELTDNAYDLRVYANEREAEQAANSSKRDRAEAMKEMKKLLDMLDDCALWDAVQRIEDMTYVPRYRKDGGSGGQR